MRILGSVEVKRSDDDDDDYDDDDDNRQKNTLNESRLKKKMGKE